VKIARIVLAALLSPLAAAASDLKLELTVGASVRSQPGYSYDYSRKVNPGNTTYPPEYGRGFDRVSAASLYAPDLGLGVSWKNLTLRVSASSFRERFRGTYALVVPSMYVYDLIASDRREAEAGISGSTLAAYLTYTVLVGGGFRVYAGAGAHFLRTKLEVMDDIVYMETVDRVPGVGFTNHRIEISDIAFAEMSLSFAGASGAAGIEYVPAGNYRIFVEGRTRPGRAEIPHPYYQKVGSVTPIELDFSGLVVCFGIRFTI